LKAAALANTIPGFSDVSAAALVAEVWPNTDQFGDAGHSEVGPGCAQAITKMRANNIRAKLARATCG
jgi:hypothetical protein